MTGLIYSGAYTDSESRKTQPEIKLRGIISKREKKSFMSPEYLRVYKKLKYIIVTIFHSEKCNFFS